MADQNPRRPGADPARISPEIYVYATNKNFLNIYDALRIEKFKIEVASYDPGSGKQTGLAAAWLDMDEMRLLIHLVTLRLFPTVLSSSGRAPRFEKFGGSERDGAIESRTFLLEWDPGAGGRFAGYPYRLTIANGPGTRTPTGAVQPKGEPTSKQAMRLPEADLMEILLAVGAYLRAKEPDLLAAKAQARTDDIRAALAARDGTGPTARPAGSPAANPARPVRPAAPEEAGEPPTPPRPPAAPEPPPGPPGSAPRRGTGPPAAPRAGGAPPASPPVGARARPPEEDDPWAGMEVMDAPPPAPAAESRR